MKVEIIDIMGNDLSVVNAARVSYAKVIFSYTVLSLRCSATSNNLTKLVFHVSSITS